LSSEITTIPDELKILKIPGLDGLRGISIIIVILSHIFISTPYRTTFAGDIGVEIFFVISGFLITTLLVKEKISSGSISLRNFYVRRVLRIMPVAYLYLLILIPLNVFLKLNIHPLSFFSSFFFIQNFPVKGFFNWYTAHYWSLSVEEQFYCTFPFLMAYNLNRYGRIIIYIIVVVPILSLLGYTKTGAFYSNHIIHVGAFIIINLLSKTVCILIGSLLSIMLFKGIIKVKDNFFTRYLSVFIFVFAVLIHTETSIFSIPYCGLFLFPLLIGIVIVMNLNPESLFTRFLSNRVLVYIGLLSYSLYICQQLFSSPTNSILNTNSIAVNLIVIFVLANASHYLCEKRFNRIKERFKSIK
jgi:peptidoglycan/LPS O-acetylase OafA/YrhL